MIAVEEQPLGNLEEWAEEGELQEESAVASGVTAMQACPVEG